MKPITAQCFSFVCGAALFFCLCATATQAELGVPIAGNQPTASANSPNAKQAQQQSGAATLYTSDNLPGKQGAAGLVRGGVSGNSGAAPKNLNFTSSNTVKGNINAANGAQVNVGGVDLGGGKSDGGANNTGGGAGASGLTSNDLNQPDKMYNEGQKSGATVSSSSIDFSSINPMENDLAQNIKNENSAILEAVIGIAQMKTIPKVLGSVSGELIPAIVVALTTGDPLPVLKALGSGAVDVIKDPKFQYLLISLAIAKKSIDESNKNIDEFYQMLNKGGAVTKQDEIDMLLKLQRASELNAGVFALFGTDIEHISSMNVLDAEIESTQTYFNSLFGGLVSSLGKKIDVGVFSDAKAFKSFLDNMGNVDEALKTLGNNLEIKNAMQQRGAKYDELIEKVKQK